MHRASKIEDTVKDRMIHLQLHPRTLGKNALDLAGKTIPFPRAPKIIYEERAAAGQILTEGHDFFITQAHVTRVLQIKKRIIEQRRISQLQHAAIRIGPDRGQLLKTIREVQIRVWIIHPPAKPTPETPA